MMGLSATVLVVDALALLAAVAGFLIAFRQRWTRRVIARLSGRDPAAPAPPPAGDAEDPLHYVMIIAGVMLMAFGIIIFGFTTSFALMTAAP